jgi:hypothetical protein
MTHISEIIEDILVEWAYRVHDGMPNPKNTQHIQELRESMEELNLPNNVIYEVIQNLINEVTTKETKFKARSAETKKIIYFKNQDNLDAALKSGTAIPVEKSDGGEEPEAEPKPKMKIDKNPMDKKDDKDEKPKSKPEVGKVAGNPKEGDNQVKNDMLKHGYSGYEKNTGSKPAPGGAGSAFNEIISGEGVHMLNENPNMSEEELAMKMYEMTKDTTLGKEQKVTAGIKAGEIPDVENKNLYTKCLVSARSAKKKHERTQKRVSQLQEQGKMGKVDKTETFYGANKSLKAQVESINTANKVFMPDGTEVTKKDAIAFTEAGGGGENPSDTATFVKDKDGNLLIQFHSDKTTTNDIQDNSTLAQEGENYKNSIDKNDSLTSEQKETAKRIVDDYSNQIKEIEENYNNQATPIAQRLKSLPIEDQVRIIENDKGTLKKNIDEALFGKGGIKPQYERYLEGRNPKDLSTQEKYEIIRKHVASAQGKTNDVKVINKVGLQLQKENPSIEGIDVKKNLSEEREKVVNLQRERVNQLNKETVDVDGVEVGVGTLMEAEETIRGFHLGLMDYPPKGYEEGNSGSMVGSALDVNMGGNIVNGEVLRGCLGVKNTTDFKQKFRLEESEKITKDAQGNVTGKVVYTYAIDSEGKKKEIGYKTYRSKAGATGKTNNTMTYSADMQDCFKTGKKS